MAHQLFDKNNQKTGGDRHHPNQPLATWSAIAYNKAREHKV